MALDEIHEACFPDDLDKCQRKVRYIFFRPVYDNMVEISRRVNGILNCTVVQQKKNMVRSEKKFWKDGRKIGKKGGMEGIQSACDSSNNDLIFYSLSRPRARNTTPLTPSCLLPFSFFLPP